LQTDDTVSNAAESEEALLRRAREGDAQALEELIVRYAPRVLRFGMKLCQDEEDARDVTQDTLLAAARGLRSFKGTSRITTWLYAIARRFCIKRRTRGEGAIARDVRIASERDPQSAESAPRAPDEEVMHGELGTAIDRGIRRLPVEQREVIVLRDIEGLTASEVAEVLGLTVEAVKSRLHRARRTLREYLSPEFAEAPPGSGCPDVIELLSKYQEGDLTQAVCKEMETHVAGCVACARRCDSLRTLLAACSAAPEPRVPPELQTALRDEVRRITGAPHQT
jgi:RNA polymerase sigma-70 factor (ECF subfamily)